MLSKKEKEIVQIIKSGGIGVMPTDTIYGLVGSAFSRKAIERIYKIKKRNKNKKLIILISSINDLKKFKITPKSVQSSTLNRFWPGKTSVILGGIAFRLPAKKHLQEILKQTGPLVAPSANPEGLAPARNIQEARKYFKNKVDFYLAGRVGGGEPSALIEIQKDGRIKVLRGNIKI